MRLMHLVAAHFLVYIPSETAISEVIRFFLELAIGLVYAFFYFTSFLSILLGFRNCQSLKGIVKGSL
jgi:hypothetical protein